MSAQSVPTTPSPKSPNFKLTLPTPPSFSAHRGSRSIDSSRKASSANLLDLISQDLTPSTNNPVTAPAVSEEVPTNHSKRLSISSVNDPIVNNDEKNNRRVSFSTEQHTISRPTLPGTSSDGSLKSPIYKIPQRQSLDTQHDNTEEILSSPNVEVGVGTPAGNGPKRRPISYQGLSPSANTSPSRFSSMAAARGISIDQSLSSSKSGSFSRSIWSAGIIPSSTSGWISPKPKTPSVHPTLISSSALRSPISKALISPTSANGLKGTASEIAKARGLSIAIIKENGQGVVVPVTPGLSTSNTTGLKSPEIKVLKGADDNLENGLASAKSIGVSDFAGCLGTGKKEIILCKFYHTPGLNCTSRPCRFVHNLSALQQPGSAIPNTANTANTASLSGVRMLSPTAPDPTSGTFAHAQMTPSTATGTGERPAKSITVKADGQLELGDVMPGERVLVQDEDGEEVVGQVFFMSGGGKGAVGKSKEKWKTVPCKDFAEGHCPYGDYCSFIHEQKPCGDRIEDEGKAQTSEPAAERPVEGKPQERRLTHRKSASLSSSLTAWTKALPKAILVPSVKVDPQVLKKNEGGLSAFAPPFLKDPVSVDETGILIAARSENRASEARSTHVTTTPPAVASEPLAVPMQPTVTAPPKTTAWSKGPPPSLRKVASIKRIPRGPAHDAPLTALGTGMGQHLMPPVSAISMFGTDSDPASPFDPVSHRRRLQELEDSLRDLPKSNLSNPNQFQYMQYESNVPTQTFPSTPLQFDISTGTGHDLRGNDTVFSATTYPWGMPMAPLPGQNDPSVPAIPGGLGVIWTPAGWAVQDAAMKNALRSAEVKARYGSETRRRTAKNYFRTKPCRFFAEGFCPHGDECTYMHVLTPSSPEQSSSSGSGSGSDAGSISFGQSFSPSSNPHPKHQTLPCKFFNSSLGCNNGDKCSFLHTRVVPESVAMVERPRPWRTKPCRHYQLGRCTLGDACHFAHVLDPVWLNSGSGTQPQNNGVYSQGYAYPQKALTEEMLEKTMEEMRRNVRGPQAEDDEDGDDDDVEIVTAVGDLTFSSTSYSPPSSIRA